MVCCRRLSLFHWLLSGRWNVRMVLPRDLCPPLIHVVFSGRWEVLWLSSRGVILLLHGLLKCS